MSTKIVFLSTVTSTSDGMSIDARRHALVGNSGNLLFEHAVRSLVSHDIEITSLDAIPNNCKNLILSMANFISPHTDLGHFERAIRKKRVRRITMIGAGAQADDYSCGVDLSDGTRRFLDLVAELSTSIGVRGDFTKWVLESLGIKNSVVIGCPSMFLRDAGGFRSGAAVGSSRKSRKALVGITPTGHFRDVIKDLFRYVEAGEADFLAQSEFELLEAREAGVFFPPCETYLRYFHPHGSDWQEFGKKLISSMRFPESIDAWSTCVSQYRLVFGSRFHGNVAAYLSGIPALWLSVDSRTRELCEYFCLPFLDMGRLPAGLTLDEMHLMADRSLHDLIYPRRLERFKSFLAENGLNWKAGGAAGIDYSDHLTPSARSLARFLDDIALVKVEPTHIIQEIAKRSDLGRTLSEKRRAEDGELD